MISILQLHVYSTIERWKESISTSLTPYAMYLTKGIKGYFCKVLPYRYTSSILQVINKATLIFTIRGKNKTDCAKLNQNSALKTKVSYDGIPPSSHSDLWQYKKHIEASAYYNNNVMMGELLSAASKLNCHIEKQNTPIILAPLHILSDLIPTLVCCELKSEAVNIIAHYDDNSIGSDEIVKMKEMNMNLINPKNITGGELRKVVKGIREKVELFVIYPDITPEITDRLTKKPMKTFDCKIFSRKARLHSGLSEIAKLAKAKVVFFCIYDTGSKLDLDIIDTLNWNEVKERSPIVIERAIKKHAPQWLLWHSPSLFYFNSSDRIRKIK